MLVAVLGILRLRKLRISNIPSFGAFLIGGFVNPEGRLAAIADRLFFAFL
ncbi:MAG: hypothetical protein ACKO2V_15405 [Snowella sp.]